MRLVKCGAVEVPGEECAFTAAFQQWLKAHNPQFLLTRKAVRIGLIRLNRFVKGPRWMGEGKARQPGPRVQR